jgi:type 1 glutamine amidotransferase
VSTGRVTIEPRQGVQKRHGKPVRALVVTGGHDYEETFHDLFEGNRNIVANIDPHPMPYRRGDLRKRYDVLVLYDSMQEITDAERKRLQDFVESGKGLVVLHHALVDYCNWRWWYQDVVGGRWYQTDDKPPRWKTTWKHDVELVVYPTAEHPVLEGVGPMHLWDETYKGMWLSPDNKVLMRTDDPSSDGPVVWISPYRQSRVVVIELGHDHNAHLHPGYRRLVTNSVLWSAGVK